MAMHRLYAIQNENKALRRELKVMKKATDQLKEKLESTTKDLVCAALYSFFNFITDKSF